MTALLPRRSWFLAAVLLLIAAQPAATQNATTDLDALLARPVPDAATITVETARQEIQRLEKFLATEPSRERVIRAYLIPYEHVIEDAAAREAAAARAVPRPKPLLFVRIGETTEIVRADRTTRNGTLVTAIRANGKRTAVQASLVQGESVWFTDEELASGDVDLDALAGRYQATAAFLPSHADFLEAESRRFREIKAGADAAREATRNARRVAGDTVTQLKTTSYDPAAAYSVEDLADILFRAERVRAIASAQAAEVDAWARPFREHFEKLLGGWTYADGRWMDQRALADYRAAQALAAEKQAFLGQLRFEMPVVALPARRLIPVLAVPAILALLLAAVGLTLLSRRGGIQRVIGAMLIAGSAAAVGGLGAYLTSNPVDFPAATPATPAPGLAEAAYAATKGTPGAAVTLTAATLNSVLADQVTFTGVPGALDATRTAVGIELRSSGLTIFEKIKVLGHEFLLRIDAGIALLPAGPVITNTVVHVGDVTLPAPLAEWFWESTAYGLGAVLDQVRLPPTFQLAGLGEGEARITPRYPATAAD